MGGNLRDASDILAPKKYLIYERDVWVVRQPDGMLFSYKGDDGFPGLYYVQENAEYETTIVGGKAEKVHLTLTAES